MKNFKATAKRFIILVFSILILFCTFFGVLSNQNVASASAETTVDSSVEDTNYVDVITYDDVFEAYYKIVIEELANECVDVPFTLDYFIGGYYSHDISIQEYTDAVVAFTISNIDFFTNSSDSDVMPLDISSSSSDADYILLSTTSYETTPKSAFARKPIYENVYDYSVLKEGDIIYETDTIFFNAGHNAIISDTDHDSYYGSYIQTIEAVGSGVSYGFLDDTRMVDYGIKILRVVDATTSIVEDALYFCEGQIGKDYSLNIFRLNTDYDSEKWYCSELVYAAYKYAGIDIGVRKSGNTDVYLSLGCLPSDIYYSYNDYEKCVESKYYVDIQLMKKSGSTWTLTVYNNTGSGRTIYYNSKMCFAEDASSWDGLSDVTSIYVSSGSSKTVEIKENWFATSVTFSIIYNSKRYITYANELENSYFTMTTYYTCL